MATARRSLSDSPSQAFDASIARPAASKGRQRKLYLREGCASLFTYCIQLLHLSEHAAYLRIEAARAAHRFPLVLERLADGSMNLTNVGLLAPHLTASKIQFTVGREGYERLRRAQDLLRHSIPNGDPAVIFERALAMLVAELERTKLAASEKPRSGGATTASSRHVPAAVRRAVWQRDGGRCAFRGTQGRCSETGLIEFHHVRPFAAGGEAICENIELRCRAHNAYEADEYFGPHESLFSSDVSASSA